jgi:hypothetical protein
MKELLCALIIFLLLPAAASAQKPTKAEENADLEIVKLSWSRFQRSFNTGHSGLPQGLDTNGVGDFSADPFQRRTNDLRILERSFPKPQKGFAYRVKLRNGGTKTIKRLFWEYRFSDPTTSETVSRRQFVCSVQMKPRAAKSLEAFSLSPPSNVVSVAALDGENGDGLSAKIIINRVDYADGSTWQRSEWAHPKNPSYPADLYPDLRRRSVCRRF